MHQPEPEMSSLSLQIAQCSIITPGERLREAKAPAKVTQPGNGRFGAKDSFYRHRRVQSPAHMAVTQEAQSI